MPNIQTIVDPDDISKKAVVTTSSPASDAAGLVVRNIGAAAGDGAIQDGVDSGIEATVLDGTTANPLVVTLTDGNGDAVAVGGGTQYTEDAAAAANPVGTALNLIRDDALSGQTTTDGDNVAARGTDKGELYVKHVDTIPVTAVGTIADDSTTPGAPVMVGGMAKSPDGTDPSSVAENDVARAITDLNRRIFVSTSHPRSLHVHLNGSSAYTDQALIADPGDGFQVIITNIIGSTGAATALNFFLEESTTTIFGPIYLEAVAGRGFASGPIHLPVTASTAVTLTSSAAIAQSYDVDYYIQAV